MLYEELANILDNGSIIEVKNNLNNFFDSLPPIQRNEALLLIKYQYLPARKAKIKTDEKYFNGLFQYIIESMNQKTEFIEQWLEQNKNIEYIQNNVFDENLLSDIHRIFNGKIWKSITLIEFLESFEGKGNKIKPKIQAEFCFILGQIENKRNTTDCPNMEKWVEATFNIKENSYSKQKIHKPNKEEILNELKLNGIN